MDKDPEAAQAPTPRLLMGRKKVKIKSPKRKKIKAGRTFLISFLPSVFTMVSLFLAFQSVIYVVKGNYLMAIYFIALCVILDGFDGTIARLTNTESSFGVQLDSLNDAITFGMTIAVLIYFWGFGEHYSKLGGIVGFLFLSAGLIRLARFNVYKEAKIYPSNVFIGLPIPVGALSICSWVLLSRTTPPASRTILFLFAGYCILISLLMISNIQYNTVKNFNLKRHLPLLLITSLIVGSAIIYPFFTIPAVTGLYILSPILRIFRKGRGKGEHPRSHPIPAPAATPSSPTSGMER